MSKNDTKLAGIALRYGVGAFCLAIATLGGMALNAQVFGSHDSRAPVEYDAGRMELQDKQNRVVFTDGVTVTQAGLTVRSDRMLVNYSNEDRLSIDRITATGGVTVSRGNESARGDVAVYDLGRNIITMAGNVSLRRGGDTLNGGRLVIDLNSGISSVDGRAASSASGQGGRVTGRFTVPQRDKQ